MSGFLSEFGGLLGGAGADHQAVGNLLGQALQSAGGVQGLLQRADQAGLGDHVRSWIGDGSNWPVSPAEIERIFPPQQLDQFAQVHGVPAGAVSGVLAQLLPHAVDQATPDNDAASADAAAAAAGTNAVPGSAPAGGGFDFGGLAKRLLGG